MFKLHIQPRLSIQSELLLNILVVGPVRTRSSSLNVGAFVHSISFKFNTEPLSFGSYWSGTKGSALFLFYNSYPVNYCNSVQLNPTTFLPLSTTYNSLAFRKNRVQPEGAPNSEEAPVIWNPGTDIDHASTIRLYFLFCFLAE